MEKNIYLKFKNKKYNIKINDSYKSIHNVIYNFFKDEIKLPLYEYIYYDYLISNKDYLLKVDDNTYVNPNYIIGLYETYELQIDYDIIIILNIITEYLSIIIKNILLINIIIQYVLLEVIRIFYKINIENKVFNYYNKFTYICMVNSLFLFTIFWMILIYKLYIKNNIKKISII